MTTEDGSRSIAGISFPQWMKNKIDHSWDLEQNALSPPEADDSFLYIRYPRFNNKHNSGEPKLADLIQIEASKQQQSIAGASSAVPDYTKHTDPCKLFIPNAKTESIAKQGKEHPIRIKSNGTDDGFKGEGAACGNSIVKVAHQMVSGKVTRGFAPAIAISNHDNEDYSEPPKGYDPTIRRGSKSLPASPLSSPHSSPKSLRRLQNKYFTGPFVDVEKHHGGSWILSGLLSKRESNLSGSVNMIAEEDHQQQNLNKTLSTASISSIDDITEKKKAHQVYKAKPSELREMNFWSPTSM